MKISIMFDKVFQVMIIKMTTRLGRRVRISEIQQ